MVHYRFETNENNRTMNLNAELPSVSWIEVIKHIFFTILLGLNIGYVQYLLFYDQRPFDEELNLYNQTMMMFYLVAAAVKMAFSVRMFINANESNFMTIASVSLLFLLMKTLSEIFQPPPISLFIFIYTYVFTSLFLFFQMTALLTNIFVTKYAVQYKLADGEEKRKFYMLMINAEADAGLVSVLDCYVRAAPQLIAQSAIFLYNNGNSTFFSVRQLISALVAIIMMPWSITFFSRSLRAQQNNKVLKTTTTVYFMWHFCIMLSRIGSISGAIAVWPQQVGIAILIHCMGAAGWLWWTIEPLPFCDRNEFWHFLFCIVFGGVYFFAPMNIVSDPTRWRYIYFYLVLFVEDTLANIVWYYSENEMKIKTYLIAFNFITFCIGMLFMYIYYKKFHPKTTDNKISEKIPLTDITSVS
jgi:hypothetical protein